MLNVNYCRNKSLLQRCKPLADYSLFTTTVRELTRKNKKLTIYEAVEEALRLLLDGSEIKKLIGENKAGVAQMVLFEYDEKAVMAHKEEVAEARGREKGRSEGMSEKAAEVAKKLLDNGVDLSIISKSTGIPVEDLKK